MSQWSTQQTLNRCEIPFSARIARDREKTNLRKKLCNSYKNNAHENKSAVKPVLRCVVVVSIFVTIFLQFTIVIHGDRHMHEQQQIWPNNQMANDTMRLSDFRFHSICIQYHFALTDARNPDFRFVICLLLHSILSCVEKKEKKILTKQWWIIRDTRTQYRYTRHTTHICCSFHHCNTCSHGSTQLNWKWNWSIVFRSRNRLRLFMLASRGLSIASKLWHNPIVCLCRIHTRCYLHMLYSDSMG